MTKSQMTKIKRVAFIDIETRKVPVWPHFQDPDNLDRPPISARWQTFMIGLLIPAQPQDPIFASLRLPTTLDDVIIQDEQTISKLFSSSTIFNTPEKRLLSWLYQGLVSYGVDTLIYSATRQFDEMILKGRFTNARRAHLSRSHKAYAPSFLETTDCFKWICLPPERSQPSNPDGLSKQIPLLYKLDPDRVRQHCREDVFRLYERYYKING